MRPHTEYEIGVLSAFPGSEYGKVIIPLLENELKEMENDFDLNAKVSDDPINQDWRFKRGEIYALKKFISFTRQYINQQT